MDTAADCRLLAAETVVMEVSLDSPAVGAAVGSVDVRMDLPGHHIAAGSGHAESLRVPAVRKSLGGRTAEVAAVGHTLLAGMVNELVDRGCHMVAGLAVVDCRECRLAGSLGPALASRIGRVAGIGYMDRSLCVWLCSLIE